ncbi:acylneuraminate cytidylyltransferase family protein [Lachnospiraceae bacterium 62-35]
MKIVALVPIKMNNQRTPGKNTKRFDDGTPLIQCILRTLLSCTAIDEVYVYCSKEKIQEYLLPGTYYLKRNPKYDTAEADVLEMVRDFALQVEADIYIWAHATAPFISLTNLNTGINALKSGEFDSAVAVQKLQSFLWKDGQPANYSLDNIPRTQDLTPLFVETCGLYIFQKDLIINEKRRIGKKPFMLEVSEIEATDIDLPEDFEIANAIYQNIVKKREFNDA